MKIKLSETTKLRLFALAVVFMFVLAMFCEYKYGPKDNKCHDDMCYLTKYHHGYIG